ncbi:hypothetical protein GCM10018773_25480 [Streptomyces candidus]|nr:hypothetical protein GCM10018773_25480 [Streptomyces candidus]
MRRGDGDGTYVPGDPLGGGIDVAGGEGRGGGMLHGCSKGRGGAPEDVGGTGCSPPRGGRGGRGPRARAAPALPAARPRAEPP